MADTAETVEAVDPEATSLLRSAGVVPAIPRLNEAAYLRAYPDVARAVERGELTSALEHYLQAGEAERRLDRPEYYRELSAVVDTVPVSVPVAEHASFNVEALIVSASGGTFIVGWTDDRFNALTDISVSAGHHDLGQRWTSFARVRRPDVEQVIPSSGACHYGFWVFGTPADGARWYKACLGGECRIELGFNNGSSATVRRVPVLHGDIELRDAVMSYFASREYCGNSWVEAFASLDSGAGNALTQFNKAVSRGISAQATAERFGPRRSRYKGSIIVPIYGIPDYLFVQNNAFAGGEGIDDYEFIYVINSPELTDRIYKEMKIGEMAYGLSQTLVVQPGNSGFGAANNVAVNFAQSDRLLCVNPDVFPQDRAWAKRHTEVVSMLPAVQTRLFGTTLYYDDGSLMHGGMYFDIDQGMRVSRGAVARRPLLRVEHYGKGAPADAPAFTASRPVPAVTGAFISVQRAWFEKLGGFSEDYIFGHYEDADLCLSSLKAGSAAWLHDIRLWHLEGKGSLKLPQHEGGSIVNRWLFGQRWHDFITQGVAGRAPSHPLLRPERRSEINGHPPNGRAERRG